MPRSSLKCRNSRAAWRTATQEAALREVNEAMRLWIGAARESGDPHD